MVYILWSLNDDMILLCGNVCNTFVVTSEITCQHDISLSCTDVQISEHLPISTPLLSSFNKMHMLFVQGLHILTGMNSS